ncbi:hypothetical protein MNBD_GAMMA21-1117 [hydrothermal vent metagenome]|uniref:Uncharacterized protein n=1 Tax=hydrothermal vent metagenome TaxID=652676 RepID=A0A3B1A5F5_9ZZZZ
MNIFYSDIKEIHSRYVHGTIELPADKFNNSAGGFENTEAAADFGASDDIQTGIEIEVWVATGVRIEHIGVEMAVNELALANKVSLTINE